MTSQNSENKNGEPVTYLTILGDDFKTSDIYMKGKHILNLKKNIILCCHIEINHGKF